MRLLLCCLLLFGLSVFPVHAQGSGPNLTAPSITAPNLTGPLEEIRIEGTDDDVLNGRIRIAIDVEPGNLAENVQLDRVRQQVLELGLFREVKTELLVRDGKVGDWRTHFPFDDYEPAKAEYEALLEAKLGKPKAAKDHFIYGMGGFSLKF